MSDGSSKLYIDRTTMLCLACSSSLPPFKPTSSQHSGIFTTNCCNRPICPNCISSNPRLARYDPCLACIGGVDAIFSGSSKGNRTPGKKANVDGAMRDEDTFVLGDDEDDESEDEQIQTGCPSSPPPYASSLQSKDAPAPAPDVSQSNRQADENEDTLQNTGTSSSNLSKYYIRSNDNLQGIALRFGVNGRELCRLNNLPPSTLSTTPHILHTLAFITLPTSARSKVDAPDAPTATKAEGKERELRLARERAEKRLQTLTKEVDWRVAKVYVALADTPELDADKLMDEGKEGNVKRKLDISGLEGRAVDHYMDDAEWEERERREGRKASIQSFPYFGNGKDQEGKSSRNSKAFWWWRS